MSSDLKIKLRDNLAIRTIAYPAKQVERWWRRQRYETSASSKRLTAFRGKHDGERCFIIGNGPSLQTDDLEKLCGEYTFAANRIYKLYSELTWRPTYWMCVDPYIIEEDYAVIHNLPGIKFVSSDIEKFGVHSAESLYIILNDQPYYIRKYSAHNKVEFSTDCSQKTAAGETVTFNAIQMAVYMGFKEIYLIGVDHSYSQTINPDGKLVVDRSVKDYFGDMKPKAYTVQNYPIATKAYQTAQIYCSTHGIKICNATRGGKLEVFPRVSLDELIS
jgi:hypothetical protein